MELLYFFEFKNKITSTGFIPKLYNIFKYFHNCTTEIVGDDKISYDKSTKLYSSFRPSCGSGSCGKHLTGRPKPAPKKRRVTTKSIVKQENMTDVPVKSEVVVPSALSVVPPVPVIPNVPLPNIPFPIIPIPGLQGSPLPPLEKPKSRSI